MDEMSTDTLSADGEIESETGGDSGNDAPQGMERRLVLRLLSHWRDLVARDLAGERDCPSFSELDPESIPDIWENAFILDILGHMEDPLFRLVGSKFATYSPIDLRNLPVSHAPRDSLIEKSVEFAQEVISRGVPISRGGEFIKPDGIRVFYRGVILPMSDDGITVSGLLGAANCREETV
jgi:hypothetical protein